MNHYLSRRLSAVRLSLWALAWCLFAFVTGTEPSKGKLTYKTGSKSLETDLKFAHFITGPDAFDDKKKIRRLIFTATSLDDKIKSCNAMNCVDQYIEGLQVDLDAAPRLLYWISLNKQLVQYSGTAQNDALTLTTDTPDHLAGTLRFDQSGAGGAIVEVTFDTKQLKAFTKAR